MAGAYPPPYNPFAVGASPCLSPGAGDVQSANPSQFQITLAQNTTIPFVCPVPKLYDGYIFIVQGIIPVTADRFSVDFCVGAGGGAKADVAFHVSPRFGQNSVVRNSFQAGQWGEEERWGAPMPIQRGQPVECLILVQNDHFKVAFNGVHYCEFRHRLLKDSVTHFRIKGDIQTQSIRLHLPPATTVNSTIPSDPPPPYQPPALEAQAPSQTPPKQPSPTKPIYNLTIPYHRKIPGGLRIGSAIKIAAKCNDGANSFSINLCHHDHKKSNIALHFNPRFYETKVMRNARSNIFWGKEERDQPRFPFYKGHPFSLVILCDKGKFQVHVDGEHFIDFNYRLSALDRIQYVIIDADVQLASVDIMQN